MTTFKYPPEAANGKLLTSEDAQATKEAIMQAIQTKHGERVFRSSYGNDIDEFLVIQDLEAVLSELKDSIAESTEDYRPLFLTVTGDIRDDGRVEVLVQFEDNRVLQTISATL